MGGRLLKHITALIAAIGILGPLSALGQITVSCRLPSPQTLLHAPTTVQITLVNNSGHILLLDGGRLGSDLRLEVERTDGRILPPLSSRSPVEGIEIMSGETKVFDLDLTRLFALHTCGFYKIRAVLDSGRSCAASADVPLEVVRGFELARLRAGVAGDVDALRLYQLEYLQTSNGENLYLRIEDERTKTVYGVFDLGPLVRTRTPELMLDEATNIHVLFQSKNMAIVHAGFTPYGVPLVRETALAVPHGDVRMRHDENGRVTLVTPPPPVPPTPPPTLPPTGRQRKNRR